MRSNKTKKEVYLDGFSLFLKNPIPEKMFNDYFDDEDGEATMIFQSWIVNNMKDEIDDWCTGIGVIEAVEHLYQTALENGNISN